MVAVVLAALTVVPVLLLLRALREGGSATGLAVLATSVAILAMGALSMTLRVFAARRSVRDHRYLLAKAYADRDSTILAADDLRGMVEILADWTGPTRGEEAASRNDPLRLTHRMQLELDERLADLAHLRERLYRHHGGDDVPGLLDAERLGRRALREAEAVLTERGLPLPLTKSRQSRSRDGRLHRYGDDE